MPISSYPNGFMHGLSVRGMPIQVAYPGKVFFVNNSSVLADGAVGGSDGNSGTYRAPFGTIAGALLACTASRGDIIMVMPGHAETVSSATGMAINVAGVMIVGLGNGDVRPTITLGTATSATVAVSADNVCMSNMLFKANLADIASAITLSTAKNFTLMDCEFRDNSSILNFARVLTTGATSNAIDGLMLDKVNMYGLGATANSCLVKMVGTNDRVTIRGCYVAHAAVTDAGLMPISTGKVVTNLICRDNIFNLVGATSATTGTLITTDGTTNSGVLIGNAVQSLDATSEILVTASSGLRFFNNYSSAVADKSGYLLPAADA